MRQLRRTADLSQRGLARALGVSVSAVNGWERGTQRLSPLARTALRLFAEVGYLTDPARWDKTYKAVARSVAERPRRRD